MTTITTPFPQVILQLSTENRDDITEQVIEITDDEQNQPEWVWQLVEHCSEFVRSEFKKDVIIDNVIAVCDSDQHLHLQEHYNIEILRELYTVDRLLIKMTLGETVENEGTESLEEDEEDEDVSTASQLGLDVESESIDEELGIELSESVDSLDDELEVDADTFLCQPVENINRYGKRVGD
eukprot:TRINITY_DN4005_c0_g1_i1.p2 TRINITY_DN4005_c0_g1~~TRINITY_DN4005_c0_g1_i1.p2  ORF type:complete len:181 (-),score=69.22 TRINITY_DN4005_c0_g1_i1:96-638(-)